MNWEHGKNRILELKKNLPPRSKMQVTMKFGEERFLDRVKTVLETLILDPNGNEVYLVSGKVYKLVSIEPELELNAESAVQPEAHSESQSESQSEVKSEVIFPEVSEQTPHEISVKEYFQSVLCFTKQDLSSLFHQYSKLKDKSVDLDVKPIVEFFHNKLEAMYEEIGVLIKKRPSLLELSDLNELSLFVSFFLTDLGVTCSQLMKFFELGQGKPVLSSGTKLKKRMEDLNKKTKLDNLEVGQLLTGNGASLLPSKSKFYTRFENLKTLLDIKNDECSNLVLKYPRALASCSETVTERVSYLTNELKRSIKEILSYPNCLTCSLEERLKPRVNQLKKVGLSPSQYSLLKILHPKSKVFVDFIEKELNDKNHSRHYNARGV